MLPVLLGLKINLRSIQVKRDMNVNDRMRTKIDLNDSEIDLNECEHFLKAKLDRLQIVLSWMDLSMNCPLYPPTVIEINHISICTVI